MKSDLLGGAFLLLHHNGVSYEQKWVGEHAVSTTYRRNRPKDQESPTHVHSLLWVGEPAGDLDAGVGSAVQVLTEGW